MRGSVGERVAALASGGPHAAKASRSRCGDPDCGAENGRAAAPPPQFALLVDALQCPAGRSAAAGRHARARRVVLKVPSMKRRAAPPKALKKPAGFAKRSAAKAGDRAAQGLLGRAAQLAQGSRRQGGRRRRRGGAARPARRRRDAPFADGDVILSVPQQCILEEKRAEASPVAAVGGSDVPAYAKVALRKLWLGQTNKWTASAVHAADEGRLGRRGRPSPAVERRRDRRRRGRRALAARRLG